MSAISVAVPGPMNDVAGALDIELALDLAGAPRAAHRVRFELR